MSEIISKSKMKSLEEEYHFNYTLLGNSPIETKQYLIGYVDWLEFQVEMSRKQKLEQENIKVKKSLYDKFTRRIFKTRA